MLLSKMRPLCCCHGGSEAKESKRNMNAMRWARWCTERRRNGAVCCVWEESPEKGIGSKEDHKD